MAASDTKTTRLELIRTKARVRVAAKGLSLLKMKRGSLVMEFFEMAKQIRSMRENMRESVARAMESIRIAEAQAGTIEVERIAAEQGSASATVNARNVMGVVIPNVELSLRDYGAGYSVVSVPTSITDAKSSFATLSRLIVEVVEKEASLRKLLNEIEKLNRRANAIENVVIPAMKSRIVYIKQRLEDLERDQTVSLKFIKRRMGNG
ncbi:MAG: V-type ATP synthase subunit D [Candidatus Marsarchaeota archaeon]|jgi:V/A-type H+-transporting ATPase subunit D|nr:V-type ATP synthase subunit D [Candidatus Marsarchaeota archaeon]